MGSRDRRKRPCGGRPYLWLAVSGAAIPDGLISRDLAIAEPVRQRRDEASCFAAEELSARTSRSPTAERTRPGPSCRTPLTQAQGKQFFLD
jgi:hypothetical protein